MATQKSKMRNKSEIKMCEMWLVFTIQQILQLDVFTANYAKMSLNDEENRFLVPVRLSLSGLEMLEMHVGCW